MNSSEKSNLIRFPFDLLKEIYDMHLTGMSMSYISQFFCISEKLAQKVIKNQKAREKELADKLKDFY